MSQSTNFFVSAGTPRSKITYNNDEYRQNALKIRSESDWFRQDSKSNQQPTTKLTNTRKKWLSGHADGDLKTPHTTDSGKKHYLTNGTRPCSASWFIGGDDNGNKEKLITGRGLNSQDAKKIQEKFESRNQHDWYKHGPEVADPIDPSQKQPKSRRSNCQNARERMHEGNSNRWFRHDNLPSAAPNVNHKRSLSLSSDQTPLKDLSIVDNFDKLDIEGRVSRSDVKRGTNQSASREFASSIDWLLNDQSPISNQKLAELNSYNFKSKTQNFKKFSPELEHYQKRNQSDLWQIDESQNTQALKFSKGKVGENNRAKLNDSEQWFAHDSINTPKNCAITNCREKNGKNGEKPKSPLFSLDGMNKNNNHNNNINNNNKNNINVNKVEPLVYTNGEEIAEKVNNNNSRLDAPFNISSIILKNHENKSFDELPNNNIENMNKHSNSNNIYVHENHENNKHNGNNPVDLISQNANISNLNQSDVTTTTTNSGIEFNNDNISKINKNLINIEINHDNEKSKKINNLTGSRESGKNNGVNNNNNSNSRSEFSAASSTAGGLRQFVRLDGFLDETWISPPPNETF